MTQISSDKKAFNNKLISLNSAKIKILKSIKLNLSDKYINTINSLGHIISTPIFAPINVPAYSNSAVDGYALRFKDLKNNKYRKFLIVGQSNAGHPYKNKLNKNEIIRVLTGATIPKNADTIIMEEDCLLKDNIIFLPKNIIKGMNFRLYGEDIKIKKKVFDKGHKIRPQDIGILSSLGIYKIKTVKKITISIFSSGDELLNSNKKLSNGKIYDANRSMLISFLKKLNCNVIDLGIIKDNQEKIYKTLVKASKQSQLIISSGGMSLGDQDYIKKIMENKGTLKIWRLAIKPGRPVGFGNFNQTYFLGLPGNPAAAFVTFLMLGAPIIKKLSGEKNYNPISHNIPINFYHSKKIGRKEFLRVKLDNNKYVLENFSRAGAGILSSASWANGLGIIEENIENIKPGDKINYISFNELLN